MRNWINKGGDHIVMSTERISRLIKLDRNLRGVAATRDAGDPHSEDVCRQLDAERQALIAQMTRDELIAYEVERERSRQLARETL